MKKFGVNKFGFQKKSRADLVKDMQATAQNLFGDNINLGDNSPLGLFIKLLSYPLALLWHGLEGVYNSGFISTASGQSLDYLSQYIGINRKEPKKAQGTILIRGKEGFKVNAGFIVESTGKEEVRFQTTKSGVLLPEKSIIIKVKLIQGRIEDLIKEAKENKKITLNLVKSNLEISKAELISAQINKEIYIRVFAKAKSKIPANTQFSLVTNHQLILATIREKTLKSSLELPIEAIEANATGNLPAYTICQTKTKHSEIVEVINLKPTLGGADRESDTEFRRRYKLSLSRGGASTIDSIAARIYELADVKRVLLRENDTTRNHILEIDGDQLPAKSIEAIVQGGRVEEVAQAIFKSKAAGIKAYGEIKIEVKDMSGNPHIIRFSRPTPVPIYIQISNLELEENILITEITKMIRSEIIKYIGGQDDYNQGFAGTEFGEKVVYNKVIDAVFNLSQIKDATIKISKDKKSYQQENIEIKETEMAITYPKNIEVVVKDEKNT